MKRTKYQISNRSRFLTKSKYQISSGFSTLWIIVAVAVIGVIALLAINKMGKIPPAPSTTFDRQIQNLQKLSSSDEIGDIQKDLDATTLEGLDLELGEVDQSLKGL